MFRKLLLYVCNDQLTAYQWESGHLSAGHRFGNDETGREAFFNSLGGTKAPPIYLLADLIEEDFQRENLPHVLGRSRKMMVQRRLTQLYRDTPYRQAIPQGREEIGRKDDRLLFSALTNAELLKPWVDAILKQKAPLAGIYSPALMSAFLVKKLSLASDHLLLITYQSGGLRQSYFRGFHLKFSRLTPLIEHGPKVITETIARETDKTQQFLNSARLLPRGEKLDVVVLADSKTLPLLESGCNDTATLAHHFVDLSHAARQLGMKQAGSLASCDPLFLHLLGRKAPASHYALPEQTRFFRLWQTRLALYLLSSGALTGALLAAGSNSLDALQYYLQEQQMTTESRSSQAQYQTILSSMPVTVASPQDMKAAVNIEQMIARNAPMPAEILGVVSRVLDGMPQVKISQLNWQVKEGPEDGPSPPSAAGGEEPPPLAALIGIPQKPYQSLLIEGEVAPFQNDYRTALAVVRQFAAELGKNPRLQAKIMTQPLDVRPTIKLEGKAGNESTNASANFTLKLIVKP